MPQSKRSFMKFIKVNKKIFNTFQYLFYKNFNKSSKSRGQNQHSKQKSNRMIRMTLKIKKKKVQQWSNSQG